MRLNLIVEALKQGLTVSCMLAALISPVPSNAQVYPPAPQQSATADGIDGTAFARLPVGNSGYVDPNSQYCRYVTNGDTQENVIPYSTPQEWLDYRAGVKSGSAPPGITEVVCCRPQTVTLCRIGGGPTQTVNLPYTIYGQSQSVSLRCVDQWGATYTDTEQWQCGFQGAASVTDPMADGLWSDPGGDSFVCSPDAYDTGCSAACGTSSTGTRYDSCGNPASYTCYGGACPPPPSCPSGYSGTPPNCTQDTPQTCSNGSPGPFPSCPLAPQACTNGSPGPYPSCPLDPQTCTNGSPGPYPSCPLDPQTCTNGSPGPYPSCPLNPQTCSNGSPGPYPSCPLQPVGCPPGYFGTPPNCSVNPPQTCTNGSPGPFPSCPISQTCTNGSPGPFPSCPLPPPTCPSGTTGTPPNCTACSSAGAVVEIDDPFSPFVSGVSCCAGSHRYLAYYTGQACGTDITPAPPPENDPDCVAVYETDCN